MGDFLVYSESNALRVGFVKVVVAIVDTRANVELHVVHEAEPSSLPDPHNAFDQDVVATERLVGILIHADIAFDRDLPKLAAVLQRLIGLGRLEVGPFEIGVRIGGRVGHSVISMPAVVSAEKQPENFFRKRGAVWETRFQGRNTICLLNVDKGAEYINVLLAFPGRDTSVSEIVFGCALGAAEAATNTGLEHNDLEDGFEVTSGVPLSDAGVVADRKAVNQYRDRFNQLFREKADAEEEGDHERLDEIQDEMSQLAAAVSGAVGKGGKPRKLADKRKNVRDAFRNAVDRAIKQIDKYEKPLAQHLKDSIKHGNEAVYRPEVAVTWEVRPIVNA